MSFTLLDQGGRLSQAGRQRQRLSKRRKTNRLFTLDIQTHLAWVFTDS